MPGTNLLSVPIDVMVIGHPMLCALVAQFCELTAPSGDRFLQRTRAHSGQVPTIAEKLFTLFFPLSGAQLRLGRGVKAAQCAPQGLGLDPASESEIMAA